MYVYIYSFAFFNEASLLVDTHRFLDSWVGQPKFDSPSHVWNPNAMLGNFLGVKELPTRETTMNTQISKPSTPNPPNVGT